LQLFSHIVKKWYNKHTVQKQITQKTQKQISYLVFGFIVIFSISIVLILFERVRQEERLALFAGKPTVSDMLVKGASTARPSISEYREYTLSAAAALKSMVVRLENGEMAAYWEPGNTYDALMSITVPDMYQTLHFSLVQLATLLKDPEPDVPAILAKYNEIRGLYPWIFNSPPSS